jgi:YD repeat-containing protein
VVNLVGQGIEVGTPPAYSATYPHRNVRTEMRYDDGNNTIATIDTLGMITRTYYDGDNRPVTVVQNLTGQTIDDPNPPARNPSTPDQNIRTDTYYDANGNAVASQDPNGLITRTYYDPANRPQFVVQNLYGQSISVETPPAFDPGFPDRNVRIEYVYDDAGNQIATLTDSVITQTARRNRSVTVVRNLSGSRFQNGPRRTPPSPIRTSAPHGLR